jgi:hypothetical protein
MFEFAKQTAARFLFSRASLLTSVLKHNGQDILVT